jgi:hypothetical protein
VKESLNSNLGKGRNKMLKEWFDEDPGYCPNCKKNWEWVRPGKSQPTCDCHNFCYAHNPPVKVEYRASDDPSRITGEVCPKCFPREEENPGFV